MSGMTVKRAVAGLVAALAAVSSAMPGKGEFKKAQPIVNELMAPLVNDFKAKKKSALEVGAGAEAYAREAETEAAKFLLLKGAVTYYARAGEYDKAATAVDALYAAVKDIPADVMLDIISRATSRISEDNAPRLYSQYRMVSARAKAEKELSKLKAQLAKRLSDAAARRRYAELLAVSGDWAAALGEFSALKDKTGEMARAEKSGTSDAAAIAEFWWEYEPEEPSAEDAIKAHAADLYGKAMADGSLKGLKKTLAMRRIESVKPAYAPSRSGKSSAGEPASVQKASKAPEAKPAQRRESASAKGVAAAKGGNWGIPGSFDKPLLRTLDLGGGVAMEFAACPAGSFEFSEHKANITRPFWLTRTPVTMSQFAANPRWKSLVGGDVPYKNYEKFMNQFKDRLTMFMPYFTEIEGYLAWLNKKYKAILPEGCVFRLPTEAELFYAYFAGRNEADAGRSEDMIANFEVYDALVKLGWIAADENERFKYRVLGKAGFGRMWFWELPGESNGWGIFPLRVKGSGKIMVLDGVTSPNGPNRNMEISSFATLDKVMEYADEETDPLRSGPNRLLAFGDTAILRLVGYQNMPGLFFVAIGPDLVKEKKPAKAGGLGG